MRDQIALPVAPSSHSSVERSNLGKLTPLRTLIYGRKEFSSMRNFSMPALIFLDHARLAASFACC